MTIMAVTLDNLASRYGMLPSEALARASTLDLFVLDMGAKWDRYKHERANAKPGSSTPPELTQDQMLAMMKSVKEKNG